MHSYLYRLKNTYELQYYERTQLKLFLHNKYSMFVVDALTLYDIFMY